MSSTDDIGSDRATLEARWLDLTRRRLPAMAAVERWPIRLDHCFMRVCLDTVFGAPWTDSIARPAIRTMSTTDLAKAIAVAEGIVAQPSRLRVLNNASLTGRATARRS